MPGHPFQVTLDNACAWKQLAIHLIEIIVGCVEHETAGDTHGDSDSAVVEFNRKSLGDHGDSSSQTRSFRRTRSRVRIAATRLIE